jgi:phytoene synthase
MSTQPPRIATARAIQRRTGRTFHLATRLLAERARDPTYALYAFFRVADEVVDDPDPPSVAEQRRELADIRAQALGEREPTDEALAAFAYVRDEYDLEAREIEIFMDAMERDLEQACYETADELGEYLRGSSVAVAYLLLDVFAPELDPAARPHAAALAEAFQLTNFLRDVRQDVEKYDRIYLPRETLQRHGVDYRDVESLRFSDGMAAVIRDELERTEALYREGVAGIRYLPADVRFGVLLSAVLYAEHHRLIRRRGYDVLSGTPSLSTPRRLALTARTWYHWRRSRDPEGVFDAVSAVPNDGPDAAEGARRDESPAVGLSTSDRSHPTSRIAGGLKALLGRGSE